MWRGLAIAVRPREKGAAASGNCSLSVFHPAKLSLFKLEVCHLRRSVGEFHQQLVVRPLTRRVGLPDEGVGVAPRVVRSQAHH